jgi:hypothetical protein
MQVTLTSLNPPKCREVSKYKKPELEEFTREEDYEFSLNYFNQVESSLKEWELSGIFQTTKAMFIGQVLEVSIVDNKAVIV